MAIVTDNPSWGFSGTARRNYDLSEESVAILFDQVAQILVRDKIVRDARLAQKALDSSTGRHFADAMSFHGAEPGQLVTHLAKVAADTLVAKTGPQHWYTLLAQASIA